MRAGVLLFVLLVACGAGARPEPARIPPADAVATTAPPAAGDAGGARERPGRIVEMVRDVVASRFPEAAQVRLDGTARADDGVVLAALRRHTDVELAVLVLEGAGLKTEAAERAAGKKRPSCAYGDPQARTSTSGLGATLDERFETAVQLSIAASNLRTVFDRAAAFDEADRRHPGYWSWEESIVLPVANASLQLVDTTRDRRKPEVARMWRGAWKDLLALPRVAAKRGESAPSGERVARSFLSYFGRLASEAEFRQAGEQLERSPSLEARAAVLRIVDLSIRAVLPAVLEQDEQTGAAAELRALEPIRSMRALAAARPAVERAVETAKRTSERVDALCRAVDPMLAERAEDALPDEVERYAAAFGAAALLETPKLREASLELVTDLATLGRGGGAP